MLSTQSKPSAGLTNPSIVGHHHHHHQPTIYDKHAFGNQNNKNSANISCNDSVIITQITTLAHKQHTFKPSFRSLKLESNSLLVHHITSYLTDLILKTNKCRQ